MSKYMSHSDFIKTCTKIVCEYVNKHLDEPLNKYLAKWYDDPDAVKISEQDVQIILICVTPQCYKVVIVTSLSEDIRYELTYDVYQDNLCFNAFELSKGVRFVEALDLLEVDDVF